VEIKIRESRGGGTPENLDVSTSEMVTGRDPPSSGASAAAGEKEVSSAAAKEKEADDHVDSCIMSALLLVTFVMTIASGYAGSSYLLGSFASGMSFSTVKSKVDPEVPRAEALWSQHASLVWWLTAVTFATLGFTIPAKDMFELNGFGLGCLYVAPAAVGKFFLGAFVPGKDDGRCSGGTGFSRNLDDALILGSAMIARGELGFVMAQESFVSGMINETQYVACVWALFWCTLIPPIFFGWALRRKKAKEIPVSTPSLEGLQMGDLSVVKISATV
jgi:Kef-type K+ transport system membrane component KefB